MFRCSLNQYRIPAVLLIWVILIQFFCNIDSYLYAQCGQCDSAVFFMCGKALMNGMIPYTEFADSKGVLLWFIYGLGYLYDHYSYVGVFWLACIAIWGTLMISYRTARLWLEEKPALLSSMLLMVPLMYWNFYTETKAEHFCWPAVAWGIYVLMRKEKGIDCRPKHYIWLGVGIIACLMIKWSIALMMLSFVFSIGWMSWRSQNFKAYLFGIISGLTAAGFPFIVYFTIVGNWADMWQEYFVNTLSSVSVPLSETISVYSKEWLQMFTTRRFIYLLYTLPVLLLWTKKEWFQSAFPALCGLFFIALSIRHDNFGHYISVAGPFAILTIILVVQFWQKRKIRLRYLSLLGLLSVAYVVCGSIRYSDSFCTKAGVKFDKFMAVSAAMSQVDNPKIIIIGQDRGLCMASSLPGTRYWITQMGKTDRMWQEQMDAIKEGTADFVICFGESSIIYDSMLKEIGYSYFEDCYAGRIFSLQKDGINQAVRKITPLEIIKKVDYSTVYAKQ